MSELIIKVGDTNYKQSTVSDYAMYQKPNGQWVESAGMTNAELLKHLVVKGMDEVQDIVYARSSIGAEQPAASVSVRLLKACVKVQSERGKEHGNNESERSFGSVAVAFNAITGKALTAAEVCLILQILKDVRQWSKPTRLHHDSVLDGVSYAALKGEELYRQFHASLTDD
jgi:hypothetical protein